MERRRYNKTSTLQSALGLVITPKSWCMVGKSIYDKSIYDMKANDV